MEGTGPCVNSHYFLEQEVDCLELGSSDGNLSAMSNVIRTARKSFARGWRMARFTPHRSSMTYEPSMLCRGEDVLMSSQPDSHASRSPLQDDDGPTPTSATDGPTRLGSFARYDRDSRSWRTYQVSLLTLTSEPFSETWPRAGSMRSGTVSARRRSERLTSEIGSGFWPTPDASVRTGFNRSDSPNAAKRPLLAEAVKMWPTPTTRDWKDGSYCPNVPVNGLLGRAVWATPSVCGNHNRKGASPTSGDGQATQAGGALNPPWVEWLMAFPLGWTDCAPLEMDKFRLWLSAHGGS